MDELPLKSKKRIFIICPVRRPSVGFLKRVLDYVTRLAFNIEDEWGKTQFAIESYVTNLEAGGYEAYWPSRDNPHQKTDKIGVSICRYNCQKLISADEVHIWYDKNSTGSVFDIGMFFMFVHALDFKKFVIINRDDIAPTPHKSFENVILALAKEFNNPTADGLKRRWEEYEK